MCKRQEHQLEVRSYLEKQFATRDWTFSLPNGSGMETYFAQANGDRYFVKVGAPVERYLVMAGLGLSPPVLSAGELESGLSILVQPLLPGRSPSRTDFQDRLEKVALLVRTMHANSQVRNLLPVPRSTLHRDAALFAMDHILARWKRYQALVPDAVAFVDRSLEALAGQIQQFTTAGLIAGHNDMCNANWHFACDGNIYILDLESMSMEDPGLDLGALLWWYYPPKMRAPFLSIAGYAYDEGLKARMRVRMALHCLHIMLPREKSFDTFHTDHFYEFLNDFRAVLEGKENPQGYTT